MNAPRTSLPPLIQSLLNTDCYDHPVNNIKLIETHISWVFLTGDFAYKIKKPVNLGFLDFSILKKRNFYCREELRLNQRLAPEVYLSVVPISGTPEHPILNNDDNPIEFAVKMIQFPESAQLDYMLQDGTLKLEQLDAVTDVIAKFHQRINIAEDADTFGDPEHVYQPVAENFDQIMHHLPKSKHLKTLNKISDWSEITFHQLRSTFTLRKVNGFIRECHGDMHLTNLAWHNNAPLIFDCIEFNPNLRWIDTINEIAFFIMDLHDRDQPRLAHRCLNRYLENTGDYHGLMVLPFYLVYRAMVLAKVNAIRAQQSQPDTAQHIDAMNAFEHYLQLAKRFIQPHQSKLYITHGLSGSGKSTVSQQILEQEGTIRLRSDIERKRLYQQGAISQDIYSADSTVKAYSRLAELAVHALDSGYSVIIDATFLKYEHREIFRNLSLEKNIPFTILVFTASIELLRRRIQQRQNDASDADLGVLELQNSEYEVLKESELAYSITIDTEHDKSIELALLRIKAGNHE